MNAQAMTLAAARRLIAGDIDAYAAHAADFFGLRAGLRRQIGILLTPSLLCVTLHRLAHWLWQRNARRTAHALARVNFLLHKAAIHPASRIEAGLYIPHTVGIVFHGEAGKRLTLYAGAVVDAAGGEAACPHLADDVSVGARAVVAGAVRLGRGVKLSPLAVVRKDVPSSTVVTSARFPHPRSP
jgi:serine O-acetyltransferase